MLKAASSTCPALMAGQGGKVVDLDALQADVMRLCIKASRLDCNRAPVFCKSSDLLVDQRTLLCRRRRPLVLQRITRFGSQHTFPAS